MATFAAIGFGEPKSHRVCVIYDPANGEVVHTHGVVSYNSVPSEAEVEREALAVLGRLRKMDVSRYAALHVQPGEFQHGARHRVDLATRQLVSELFERNGVRHKTG